MEIPPASKWYGMTHPNVLGRPRVRGASHGTSGGQNATLHFSTALIFFFFWRGPVDRTLHFRSTERPKFNMPNFGQLGLTNSIFLTLNAF